MKFDDLIAATGIAPRQLRYLIAEGFVPPPTGGRTYATYGEAHVVAIRRYDRLRELGFPPAAIRLLLEAKEGVPVQIAAGVTLVVAPELIGSGRDAGPIAARAAAAIDELFSKEKAHAGKCRMG
jgi:DNA-binding transcriptional MerR regulator